MLSQHRETQYGSSRRRTLKWGSYKLGANFKGVVSCLHRWASDKRHTHLELKVQPVKGGDHPNHMLMACWGKKNTCITSNNIIFIKVCSVSTRYLIILRRFLKYVYNLPRLYLDSQLFVRSDNPNACWYELLFFSFFFWRCFHQFFGFALSLSFIHHLVHNLKWKDEMSWLTKYSSMCFIVGLSKELGRCM